MRDIPEHYGADIFKSGRVTQPKNPYFVAKIQERIRDKLVTKTLQVYILVNDYIVLSYNIIS